VTRESSPDFVPTAQRIVTFDNDGTLLWVEHPMYAQLVFALDCVKAIAPLHPEWKDTQPFKAVLEGDMKALAEGGDRGLAELVMTTHAGMTTEEFQKIVTDWLLSARDPKFKRPYTELVYQPMIRAARLPSRQRVQDFYRLRRRCRIFAPMVRAGLRRATGASNRLCDQDEVSDARRAA
jgi:FMN phosphatase YigB (HAD superfamily)